MEKAYWKIWVVSLATCLCSLTSQAEILNASFEADAVSGASRVVDQLSGWEVYKGQVELVSKEVMGIADGEYALDLNGEGPGAIRQTVTGLKKNQDYTLKFAYADQKGRGNDPIIATADVFVNGEKVATLRNKSSAPDYIDGIGFSAKSTAEGSLEIAIESTLSGPMGLVVDNVRLEEGPRLAPPEHRRQVFNGSFEMPIEGNDHPNPHLFGGEVPGWLVMRENIDLINYERFGAPHGKVSIDLGGHGAGGIAQTITGLEPGARYQLSLLYSRHMYWNSVDALTGEVYLDDEKVLSLSRVQLYPAPRWERVAHEFDAPEDGSITLSLFSTSYSVGGGILYDDIRIDKKDKIMKPDTISVLILDGFSNHDWKKTTTYLKEILASAGKFDVEVSTCPDRSVSEKEWERWNPRFARYDVVIQTCNDIGKPDVSWPDRVKASFEKYVKRGGGVYMLHSANNAFPNWEEYNRMIGLGWRNKDFGVALSIDEKENVVVIPKGEGDRTGHGKRLDTVVTRMGNHPIHNGIPKQWMAADLEIYRYARGPAENLEVISYANEPKTGLNFPIEWIVNLGKGRVYNSTYGHVWHSQERPDGIRCVAFQEGMFRALQWLSGNEVDSYVSENFPTKVEVSLADVPN